MVPCNGHIRMDKILQDDKDLTRYFQQVLLLREDDCTRHVAFFLLLTVPLADVKFFFICHVKFLNKVCVLVAIWQLPKLI